MTARIALIGDYDQIHKAHQAIPRALSLAADRDGACEWEWLHTSTLPDDPSGRLSSFQGVWCVPASPYTNPRAAIAAIGFARERCVPFLGTCGGFQHALIEYADAAWGIADPTRTGGDPYAPGNPVIAPLACALVEVGGEVFFEPGSRLEAIYGCSAAVEGYHCSYGINPRCVDRLETGPLRVSARDAAGDVRAVELDGHPFFFATLYQAERSAFEARVHPLIAAFVNAVRSI